MRPRQNRILSYEKRVQAVINHIYDNLGAKDLDLNRLSEVANMSPYHWHRVYHAMMGETVFATVKRLRLHRAADYLANSSKSISEIARISGYPNIQSFTRIFRDVYNMTPAVYRKHGSHTNFSSPILKKESTMYSVEIVKLPKTDVVAIPHTGSYMEIGRAFETLYTCANNRNLFGPFTRAIGIYYDDPGMVAESDLKSKACLVVDSLSDVEAPLERDQINEGTYAKLQFVGPYADMRAAYEWLYGQWLKSSGYEVADAPCFEEYLNNPKDTPPTELKTDIYMPLQA